MTTSSGATPPWSRRDEQRDETPARLRTPSRTGVIAVLAALVVASTLSTAGCGSQIAPADPTAADFLRPVGPLRLLRAAGGDGSPQRRSGDESERATGVGARVATAGEAGRTDGKRVPDSKIRLDFGMKLEESALADAPVDFEVRDQTVVLTGAVGTSRGRDRAELLARSVDGVLAVQNRLRVDPSVQPADARTNGGD